MGKLFKKLNDRIELNGIKENRNVKEAMEEIRKAEQKVLFENYVSNLISDLENTKEGVKDGKQK